jgi:glycosyltransferase involved in cell wall biosynthesis
MLGPYCSTQTAIPYVIFQGIYSTKRRRRLKTLPGFLLNRKALLTARMVYTNKRSDEKNLARLLPEDRLRYIAPGIRPKQFDFDAASRAEFRHRWQVGDKAVIFTAAMFRPGVKTQGLKQVIASCGALKQAGKLLSLVIAGDGQTRSELEEQAQRDLGPDHLFLGKIPRQDLYRCYSAADIFAFPGIRESLGMVYLEAQAAGLPVVAFRDWGAAEAVQHNRTGLLTPADQPDLFTTGIGMLLEDSNRRKRFGDEARKHILTNHDISRNYRFLMQSLEQIACQRH